MAVLEHLVGAEGRGEAQGVIVIIVWTIMGLLSQPNLNSTRVGSDKVIGWPTPHRNL